MGDWTGTVPSYAAGDEVTASKMQIETAIQTALTASWTDWTPTLTNLTQGNGTVTARYRRLGKTVDFYFKFVLGSTSAVGTAPQFTLPVATAAHYYAAVNQSIVGTGIFLDSGLSTRPSWLLLQSATVVTINYIDATPKFGDLTATVPWTWGTADTMSASGTYEAA